MINGSNSEGGGRVTARVDPDLADIIPGFFERRQEDIEDIREALDREDYEAIGKVAHTMKGMGSGYGFHPITDICHSLEQAARAKCSGDIRDLVHDLCTYIDSVEVVYEWPAEPQT